MLANKPKSKLFLTGASGLLGRAIFNKFESEGWDVYGVALTRVQKNLHELDITKEDKVREALKGFQPHFVIHAAAQRFPDKVDSDPDAASILNVEATRYIVNASAEVGAPVLYISTDYVFDGAGDKAFTTQDKPNPINLYGKTKLQGENVTLQRSGNLVLRVPVLYGHVLYLKESAVTCLLEPLLKEADTYVSHLERRCPSYVDDIALICLQLANSHMQGNVVHGIFQWCGEEKMTKYQMILKIADVFKIQHSHIKPEVKQGAGTTRPMDPELDRSRLLQMGFGQHTPFGKGIHEALSTWVSQLDVRTHTG